MAASERHCPRAVVANDGHGRPVPIIAGGSSREEAHNPGTNILKEEDNMSLMGAFINALTHKPGKDDEKIVGYYDGENQIRPVDVGISAEEFARQYPGKKPVMGSHLAEDTGSPVDQDPIDFI